MRIYILVYSFKSLEGKEITMTDVYDNFADAHKAKELNESLGVYYNLFINSQNLKITQPA